MPQFPFRHVCWKASRLLHVRFLLFSFSFLSLTWGHFHLCLFLSFSATQGISSTVEVKGTLPTRTFRGESVSEENPYDWE